MKFCVHRLTGCSPAPLANYLKALGVLRLIAEQADPAIRGWWQDEQFCLLSRLTEEELRCFFLNVYAPTPFLSPWNKGCGFFKPGDPGMSPIENSTAPRFARFRDGIQAARQLIDEQASADAIIRAIKARTKTNKTFQTSEERELLAGSRVFAEIVEQLSSSLATASDGTTHESLSRELSEVKLLVAEASGPPTGPVAARIKASSGYKRLLAAAERIFANLKARLIPTCRAEWRGPHAHWLSTAVVLSEDGSTQWPSLLGTGGNDGNLDFTNTAMQMIVKLFEVNSPLAEARAESSELLENSLWGRPSSKLESSAIGQFQPGAAGGANSTNGPTGESLVNPWDFLLLMEGSLLFVPSATRTLDPHVMGGVSAPFALRSHAAGYSSAGGEKSQRGEQWMPLWSQPCTVSELVGLFGEARVQLGRQTANRAIDVVKAIARLGVARGISSFVRYGYLERNGQSTLAVPLGRIEVQHRPEVFLTDDLARWHESLRRRAGDKNASNRLIHAERQLSESIISALTHDSQPSLWQSVLLAAVDIERLQATGAAIEAGPVPSLQPEWIRATFDNAVAAECRLALALGSAAAEYKNGRSVDSVRFNCLPLEGDSRWPKYRQSDKRLLRDPRVVVTGRDSLADSVAIVERRLVEAGQRAQRRLPLNSALGCSARLADLAAFVEGRLDVDRVFNLARAYMSIDWRRFSPKRHLPPSVNNDDLPPEGWMALRLSCLPWPILNRSQIPVEPSMIRRLQSGDAAGAVDIAIRRLRGAGLAVPFASATCSQDAGLLWAAALAFPISRFSAERCAEILVPSLKGSTNA